MSIERSDRVELDDLPNEILCNILLLVPDTNVMNVCRRWCDLYKIIDPKRKKLKKAQNLCALLNRDELILLSSKLDIYDIRFLELISGTDFSEIRREKVKKLRTLFSSYKNCNINANRVREIIIRFNNPNIATLEMHFACVILLHYNSFDVEIHGAGKTFSVKLSEFLNISYDPNTWEKAVEIICEKTDIKSKCKLYFSHNEMLLAYLIAYSEKEIKALLHPLHDICNKCWL
jgi:hypothetical protein